jgi:hypothetical protein
MTQQLTLPPNTIAAFNANAPYAKARRAAYLRLAEATLANPGEPPTPAMLADAEMVLRPTVMGEGV